MGELVTPEALRATAGSSTILDVRYRLSGPPARDDYDAGHVPGAVFVDLDRDLAASPGRHGRHPLPSPESFQAAMRRAGVTRSRAVVCYDFGDGMGAARAWWLLRYFGHPDVRVLDGGYDGWLRAGGGVSASPADAAEGDFVVEPGHARLLDADEAAALAAEGALLDSRAPARYRGEQEPIDPVAGHVPGALNAPLADLFTDARRLPPAEELRTRFAALGVEPGRPVGAYCGSGVAAAHLVLALEVAGFPDAGLYADSWSGWITDPRRPVAVGERPDG
jgi:thiosulfate/3-mercaptopyruvate sulfurtransferase